MRNRVNGHTKLTNEVMRHDRGLNRIVLAILIGERCTREYERRGRTLDCSFQSAEKKMTMRDSLPSNSVKLVMGWTAFVDISESCRVGKTKQTFEGFSGLMGSQHDRRRWSCVDVIFLHHNTHK